MLGLNRTQVLLALNLGHISGSFSFQFLTVLLAIVSHPKSQRLISFSVSLSGWLWNPVTSMPPYRAVRTTWLQGPVPWGLPADSQHNFQGRDLSAKCFSKFPQDSIVQAGLRTWHKNGFRDWEKQNTTKTFWKEPTELQADTLITTLRNINKAKKVGLMWDGVWKLSNVMVNKRGPPSIPACLLFLCIKVKVNH